MEELEATSALNMRQFLMKQIIPVLTEGMIDVYRVGPTDPADYLAEYIFQKSNNLRKQVKTKKQWEEQIKFKNSKISQKLVLAITV